MVGHDWIHHRGGFVIKENFRIHRNRARDTHPLFHPSGKLPGTPLLVVDTLQGELLIPLAEEICTRIDLVARRIEVVLPGGLREVNAEA